VTSPVYEFSFLVFVAESASCSYYLNVSVSEDSVLGLWQEGKEGEGRQ
jgi:hypothetical protein